MKTIRVFGKSVDPAVFRRGYGASGFFIWLLNEVRAYLEKVLVLRIIALWGTGVAIDPRDLPYVLRRAESDPFFNPEEMHPLAAAAQARREEGRSEARYHSIEERTADLYVGARRNSSPDRPVPISEGPFSVLIAEALPERRAYRYVRGDYKVQEAEDDSAGESAGDPGDRGEGNVQADPGGGGKVSR